jgi:hypothetical protein
MDFDNSTDLHSGHLSRLFLKHTAPYRHQQLMVRVRYSRSSDFSGTCFYRDARIFINLGRSNRYPYTLATHLAKAKSNRRYWWRESYKLTVPDPYMLALFIYLHELYHFLVKSSGRCTRRKEAMCDRFAARVLIDEYGCALRDSAGRPVARENWDFQDLHRFVARAPKSPTIPFQQLELIPVIIRGA